jgi:hypothetical protein
MALRLIGPKCRILLNTRDARIITAVGASEYRLDVLKEEEAAIAA